MFNLQPSLQTYPERFISSLRSNFTAELPKNIIRGNVSKNAKSVQIYLEISKTHEINTILPPIHAILPPMHPKMVLRQPKTKNKNLKKYQKQSLKSHSN